MTAPPEAFSSRKPTQAPMAWEAHDDGDARLGPVAACLLAMALTAATVALPGGAAEAEDEREIPVRLGGLNDVAVLEPADPRSDELRAQAPEAAEGLLSGTLAERGWSVDLVSTEEASLGLVQTPAGPTWLHLVDGALLPVDRGIVSDAVEGPIDRERDAPADARASTGSPSPKNGVLQLALEGDYEYYTKTLAAWDAYQLQVIHLVNAIYAEEVQVPFEVVGQRIASSYDQPVTGDEICVPGDEDVLQQFRDHRERSSATRDSERELAHLFTGKTFSSDTIGCAYLSEIDTAYAYGVSQTFGPLSLGDRVRDVVLVAHELGHNFDGWHHRSMPTPGGTWEMGSCTKLATIMNPCLGDGKLPTFSNTYGLDPLPWESAELAQDGGNQPHMQAYGQART